MLPQFDYERFFQILNGHDVRFLLIGGLNYYLNYRLVTTQDIDIWIAPDRGNILKCEVALNEISAQWGPTDDDWGQTARFASGWLARQAIHCLLTDCGMVDIFSSVIGLSDFDDSWQRSERYTTVNGVPYRGLGARDMLACQLAIPESSRRLDRTAHLKEILGL